MFDIYLPCFCTFNRDQYIGHKFEPLYTKFCLRFQRHKKDLDKSIDISLLLFAECVWIPDLLIKGWDLWVGDKSEININKFVYL